MAARGYHAQGLRHKGMHDLAPKAEVDRLGMDRKGLRL